MQSFRTFVALPLDATIHARLESLHRKLKSLPADVKWVRPDSIHLTLKFLGNVAEPRICPVSQAIERGIRGFKPWTATVRKIGMFPTMRNPRIVWVGLDDSTNQLLTMQQRIESELAMLGFEKEKRAFTPHLTLGRVRSPRGKKELVTFLIDERESEFGNLPIQRVLLFKSDLTPSGAVYTALQEFLL